MNRFIIFCALLSICAAAVIPDDSQATIVKYESSNDGSGNYHFWYETSNGIIREERGYLVTIGDDQRVVVKGSYKYNDDSGKPVVVNYTADESGYHPGLPTPSGASIVPAKILAKEIKKAL